MIPRPLLEVHDLSVRLGRRDVLRGVALSLRPGEIVGVLGPSGAGKSTLFGALAGEIPLVSGQVRLGGEPLDGLPLWERARRGLGWVPQTPSVLFDLTLEKNLRAFERIAGKPARPAGERAAALGLETRIQVRASALSGGERRRLELLRALVAEPRVLLCDEPFSGVDPDGAQRIGRVLRDLVLCGAAVLVADHRVAEVLAVCDRALLLSDGAVEAEAPASEFAAHPAVRLRYLA